MCSRLVAERSVAPEGYAQAAYRARVSGTDEAWRAAAHLFHRAVIEDSASAQLWCELGEATAQSGDIPKAEYCYLRGLTLSPMSPAILLDVGDFYFNIHEQRRALPYFRKLLSLVSEYDERVFIYYNGAGLNLSELLESGIPDQRAAASFLRFFLKARDLAKARIIWNWIASHAWADPGLGGEYVRLLMERGLYAEAASVWTSAAPECDGGYPRSNAIYNSDFECEPSKSPFDWQMWSFEGAEPSIDKSVHHEGHASLRLHFDGQHNVDYHHTSQDVFVPAGEYVLEAWIRTEGITTDEGIRLRLLNAEDPKLLDLTTESLTGTADWTRVTRSFRVGPKPARLQLYITRRPSLRFDSLIAGSAWVDSVAIRRADPRR